MRLGIDFCAQRRETAFPDFPELQFGSTLAERMVSVTHPCQSAPNDSWASVGYNGVDLSPCLSKSKVNLRHSPLDPNFTCSFALFEAIKNQRFRQVVLLLQGGADVNARNEFNETPLIFIPKAILGKENKLMRDRLARLFLDWRANPNLQDIRGMTSLMYAASKGQHDLVQLLMSSEKTAFNIQDKEGNTALMHSIKCKHKKVVETFVNSFARRRADVNQLRQRNNEGKTALELAKESGLTECVLVLTNYVTKASEEVTLIRKHQKHPMEMWASLDSVDSVSLESVVSSPPPPPLPSERKRRETFARPRLSMSDDPVYFDYSLKKKLDDHKKSESSEKLHEMWEHEARSWFASDGSQETDYGAEGPIEFKLPPINPQKLVDYKTWCERGQSLSRRTSLAIVKCSNPS